MHNDHGIALFNLRKYDQAQQHYLEAKRIWEKGRDNNLVGSALFNLAMIYKNRADEKKKAEEHFRQAHESVTTAQMHAHVCRELGNFLAQGGRDNEALPLLQEGRNLAKKTFGTESGLIPTYNDALIPVLRRLGLVDKLKVLERESAKIRRRLAD